MSILIKGMEMPTGCYDCPLKQWFGDREFTVHYCYAICKEVSDDGEIDADCPLVPVPPHGRLIEAEPILKFIQDGLNSGKFGNDVIQVMTEIQYAPAVIPPERLPSGTGGRRDA